MRNSTGLLGARLSGADKAKGETVSLFVGAFCAIAFEETIRITEIGKKADFGVAAILKWK
jgi:hypothetical protein